MAVISQMVHQPKVITKNLAFNCVGNSKKVRLSSNFLQVMGFKPGQRVKAIQDGSMKGFSVIHAEDGPQQVYSRSYRRGRSNSPLEAVMEFGGKALIQGAFPAYTQRFHVDMRPGRVRFTPMANRVHAIHSKLRKSSPFNAFVGLTGGVDIHCLESLGWTAQIVLEHRPQEARDLAMGRNLTEVNALNTLVNGSPRILINEDIYHFEIDRLEQLLADAPPITLCHFSLGCDDHSTAKSQRAKEQSFDDLSTMYDMVYPVLKQIEHIGPAAVVVENVKQFASSGAGKILTTTLRRLGYHLTEVTRNALDAGGLQGRERYYLVASIYPGFQAPTPTDRNVLPLHDLIIDHLPECRDVTNTKSIIGRPAKGRAMPPYITVNSTHCPTILKSQDRGISDAVYVEHEGRIYKPSLGLLKALMSIPGEFNVDWMAKEQATETLGQSIDYRLHHSVMAALTQHLEANLGKRTIIELSKHAT
jgi:DNA (cytosine-5)-methyltransferase 1